VRFRGELSDWGTVSIGVPQGSILGPLLFAYVNDLPRVVQYSILDLYADDAEMHCSHSDLGVVERKLQSDLDDLVHWLCCSCLCLNILKSNSLLIGSRQRVADKKLNVSVGGKLLAQVSSVHYLGVTIDSSLSWNLHISNVVSKIRSQIVSLFCFGSLSPVMLCMLYTAFVLPLYGYCDVVWSPTTAKFTSLLERVQCKFTKKLPPSCASRLSFTLTECRHSGSGF